MKLWISSQTSTLAMCQPSTDWWIFSCHSVHFSSLWLSQKRGIILLWYLNLKRCLLVGDAVCLLVIRETSNNRLAERAGKTWNSFIYKKLIEIWNSSISTCRYIRSWVCALCLVLVVKTGCLLPNWLSLFHFLIMGCVLLHFSLFFEWFWFCCSHSVCITGYIQHRIL